MLYHRATKTNEPTTSYGTALSQLSRRRCTLLMAEYLLIQSMHLGTSIIFFNGVKKKNCFSETFLLLNMKPSLLKLIFSLETDVSNNKVRYLFGE